MTSMDSEDQAGVLNRALGYEIATLLMNRPMSRAEIQSLLPYEQIHDTQIERIIDACYEEGIFDVTAERGPDKFELDYSQFNQMGLRAINIKAVTRMISPAQERGGSIEIEDMPDEFFVCLSRERDLARPACPPAPHDRISSSSLAIYGGAESASPPNPLPE